MYAIYGIHRLGGTSQSGFNIVSESPLLDKMITYEASESGAVEGHGIGVFEPFRLDNSKVHDHLSSLNYTPVRVMEVNGPDR